MTRRLQMVSSDEEFMETLSNKRLFEIVETRFTYDNLAIAQAGTALPAFLEIKKRFEGLISDLEVVNDE